MTRLDHLRRSVQLKAYELARVETPAPFDHSDRMRLKAMRASATQRSHKGPSSESFWERVHSDEKTPLHRERKSIQSGMQYWFDGSKRSENQSYDYTSVINSLPGYMCPEAADIQDFWIDTESKIKNETIKPERKPRLAITTNSRFAF